MLFKEHIFAADEDAERERRKIYAAFSNHIDVYEAAVNAYLAIARAFSSKEINNNPNREVYHNGLREWMQQIGGSGNVLSNFMAVEKRYIETRVSLPAVSLNFDYRNQANLEAAERIIKEYFPNFTMPRSFKKNAANSRLEFEIGQTLVNMLSVEKLTRSKPAFTPAYETEDATAGFKLAKNYAERGFGGIANLQLSLQLENVYISKPGTWGGLPDSGSLLDGYIVTPTLTIEAVFRWPIDFAKWVTCTDDKDEFIPFMFFQYMNAHRSAYLSKRTRGGGYSTHTPSRVNNLGKIVEMMTEERRRGRIVKIRTNADNFLILGTGEPASLGSVLWVPIVNNVPKYMEQIKSCYDATNQKMVLSNFKMGGEPVLTDSSNEKFTYVRESATRGSSDISGLITFDLTGSVALDNTTIYRHLYTRLDASSNEKMLSEFIEGIIRYYAGQMGGSPNSETFSESRLQKNGFDTFDARKGLRILSEFVDFVKQSPDLELRWMHFYSGNKFKLNLTDRSVEEGSEDASKYDFKIKRGRAFLETVFQASMGMFRDFGKLTLGFAAKVEKWRFWLYLVSRYSTDSSTFAEDYQDKVLLNTARQYTSDEIVNPKGLVIPNMPGLKKALPHQIECMLDFAQEPEMTLLEADVGGGKGMMGPVQALMLLQQKRIRRPLFLVPGRLVPNWTNEIGKYTEGQVNPFPLTLSIVRRLQRVFKGEKGLSNRPDYVFLKKIVNACPVNTFFISSLDFLTSDAETITYANSEARRYYVSEFFRDMGIFDLVVIDEAHTVKNLSARATVAASIVTSVAKYKTEMSGTLVSNTLTDLVGESAIANPAALGNTKRFVNRYGLVFTGRGGEQTVSTWKPDAAAMIVNDMKPYAKRIIKKKDRWAFILPKTNELFHTCYFTKNQQDYYDLQISKKLEDLKTKNPGLYEKMTDGNDKDDTSVSMGLDMHFQALEAFVGAPDSDQDYASLQGLSDDDLTSPKLKETVKILDKHFGGYTDDEGSTVAPSKHKVIIFAARIPTVEHFERRMPEKYKKRMAVYYAGREDAIEAFLNVPGIDILVAAEMSANTGRNFQIASRLIRCEALWAPGGQIQAAGRIDRPDFNNSGRDEIYLDWIMVNKTLDVAKIGRIISKNVEKMKYDRQEDPYFVARPFTPSEFMMRHWGPDLPEMRKPNTTIEKMFTSLPLIKMNTETFKKVNDVDQLGPYFASYSLILDFQNQQYTREKETGLHQLVEIRPDMRASLPGSKKIQFMPRIPNVDPAIFDRGPDTFGYKPISRMETEINIKKMQAGDEEEFDEDNATYVDINPVSIDDIIDTEFGIGKVTKILKNEVWVDIPGFRPVRVLKATAWLITNEGTLKKVKSALAKGKTFVRTLPGAGNENAIDLEPEDYKDVIPEETPVISPPKVVVNKPEPVRPTDAVIAPKAPAVDDYDKEEQESDEKDSRIDIYAEIVDGQVALTCFAADKDADDLILKDKFTHFASYYAIKVKTPKALTAVLAVLSKDFTIADQYLSNFDMYKLLLRNPDNLDATTPSQYRNSIRFFNVDMHRRLKPGVLRPYPIVFGKDFFIAIDVISTPSYRQALLAIQKAAIPGVKIIKNRQDDVCLRLFNSPAAAAEALKEIARRIKVPNLDETLDYLKNTRRRTIARKAEAPVATPTVQRGRPVVRKA